MSPDETPQLSVIIASSRDAHSLTQCLQALIPQTEGRPIEVLVVGYLGDGTTIPSRYPEVSIDSFPAETPLPTLYGAGLRRATAPLLALIDSTTIVSDDWVASVLEAHTTADYVIGGAVEPLPDQGATDWAAYFCDYGQFMLPRQADSVQALPGNNIIFDRALLAHGSEYVEPEFWKTYWCRQLQDQDISLRLDPSIVVYNAKQYRFIPYLVRRFRHGRCFGGMRIEELSSTQRILYASGTTLLPFVFMLRIARAILPKRRHLSAFLLTLPLTIAAVVSWSLGEGWGYIKGPGESCEAVI